MLEDFQEVLVPVAEVRNPRGSSLLQKAAIAYKEGDFYPSFKGAGGISRQLKLQQLTFQTPSQDGFMFRGCLKSSQRFDFEEVQGKKSILAASIERHSFLNIVSKYPLSIRPDSDLLSLSVVVTNFK